MTEHEILDVCHEKFKVYDEHVREGVSKRLLIERHDEILTNMLADRNDVRRFFFSVVIVIIIQICSFLYLWGQQTQIIESMRVDVQDLKDIHPRLKADIK